MTTVYFVRHCQSETSHQDNRTRPLTAQGVEDSAAVAEVLHDVPMPFIAALTAAAWTPLHRLLRSTTCPSGLTSVCGSGEAARTAMMD